MSRDGRRLGAVLAGLCALPLLGGPAAGRYVVQGDIEATECVSYLVARSCSRHHVDAVNGLNGSVHAVRWVYDTVTEYKDGRCRVDYRTHGYGVFSTIFDIAARPRFYERQADGSYREIGSAEIGFACVEVEEPAAGSGPGGERCGFR